MTEEELERVSGELADKIVSLARGTLLLNMRFLAKAVSRLPAQAFGEGLSCDGRRMLYEPRYVLKRYKQNERLPVHDHLHMLLHCIFRHWHTGDSVRPERWDAACDIAAEAMIMKIASGFCGNEREAEKASVILDISANLKPLTAEKIYAYLLNVPDETVAKYLSIFRVDDHSGWHKSPGREYEPEDKLDVIGLGTPDESGENDESDNGGGDGDEQNGDEQPEETPDGEESSDEMSFEDWLEENRRAETEQLEQMWKDISKEIQSELENFDKSAGEESKYLTQTLDYVNRDKCDYTAFLKKFAVSGEVLKPDPDMFDQNFYTYGLSLYGNVALIEPLEYKETKLVRDFVIAVDTSGSVSGKQVESFIRKTYSILKSEESFFTKVNIYIIQCDTEVREAVKISSPAEFEKYMSSMEIKGLGGTDFRAVFEYVDELIKAHEFSALKGMIYFTDGFGKFPERSPSYETAFAFLRSDYENSGQPDVPPWAIKLILEEEDILYG